MLDKTRPEQLNEMFRDSVRSLDRAISRLKLVRKQGAKLLEPDRASAEELAQLLTDLKMYRQRTRVLDKV